jgi:lysophospholipase L1-like esterase
MDTRRKSDTIGSRPFVWLLNELRRHSAARQLAATARTFPWETRMRTLLRRVTVAAVMGLAPALLAGPAAAPAGAVTAGLPVSASAAAGVAPAWVATWTASPTASTASFPGCPGTGGVSNRTIRNVVFTSVGGDRVRVRLTNAFGTQPLRVGTTSVALAAGTTTAATVPGTMRTLTFGGQASIVIPAGGDARSDPVQLDVPAHQSLAVSMHIPEPSGPTTIHRFSLQRSFSSTPGDFAAAESATAFSQALSCWVFLDAVDVEASGPAEGAVMALGDSITDGANTASNVNLRWTNVLSRRLATSPGPTLSVVNAGLVGNEVSIDRQPVIYGVSAVNRLDRDVLSHAGVRLLIVMEGINDIGAREATPAQVIAAYREIVARAHANGVKVVGGTLTPSGGSGRQFPTYASPETERDWRTVNDWIRTSGVFDAVVDFAAAVADPANPWLMAQPYDSGDGLHPNAAGMQAIANAVDLDLLRALLAPGTWFASLEQSVEDYAAGGALAPHVAAALRDRLARGAALAQTGSETRAIAYVEQFRSRARNQVKGDDADVAVRDALVAEATDLIAFLQRQDDVENGVAVVRVPKAPAALPAG